MPKKRSDGAPATEVAAFLVPKYLCACPVGVTTAVQTAYAGSVDVTNEKKGTVYKCLHCPAQFCGIRGECKGITCQWSSLGSGEKGKLVE
jgi:hypothetical protein